jgi:hypothetical protein
MKSYKQSVAGLLYVAGLIVASVTMPMYGGSMYWEDTLPRAATFADENFVVFVATGGVFLVLTFMLYLFKGDSDRNSLS